MGVDDAMSNVIWTRNFLLAQGVQIDDNVVYQDNQSAILLERNGRRSSGKRTRHIDIRYFFITDRIAKKEIRVEYCPTTDMLADMFTKPLQGGLFRKLRNKVLNVEDMHTTESSPQDPVSQECVGNTGWELPSCQSDRSGDRRTDTSSIDDPATNGWILVRGKRGKHLGATQQVLANKKKVK